MRLCKRCNGFKHTHLGGYVQEGKALRERVVNCAACRGEGVFHDFDRIAILRKIMENQGRNKGQLRSKMEIPSKNETIQNLRAYYVWHMIKSQAKEGMKLPVFVDFGIKADDYQGDLNEMAQIVSEALSWGKTNNEIPVEAQAN